VASLEQAISSRVGASGGDGVDNDGSKLLMLLIDELVVVVRLVTLEGVCIWRTFLGE